MTTASGGYRAFLIRAVDVTFWTALALGLVLALCLALIGGVSGEVSADLSAEPLEGAWLILLLPALALLFAFLLSPISWALRGGARAVARATEGRGKALMDATQISTTPDPLAPYRISQAFRVGELVITSGQAAIDSDGQLVGVGDFAAQADQVFANLAAVLEAAGSSLEQVVKVTIYLTDMAHFPAVVGLRERYFTPPYPADTIVEVKALALPELEIEIEATALAGGRTVAAAEGA